MFLWRDIIYKGIVRAWFNAWSIGGKGNSSSGDMALSTEHRGAPPPPVGLKMGMDLSMEEDTYQGFSSRSVGPWIRERGGRYLPVLLFLLALVVLPFPMDPSLTTCYWGTLGGLALILGQRLARRGLAYGGLCLLCVASLRLVFWVEKTVLSENFLPLFNARSALCSALIAIWGILAFWSAKWRWAASKGRIPTGMLLSFLLHFGWVSLLSFYLTTETSLVLDYWRVMGGDHQRPLMDNRYGDVFSGFLWIVLSVMIAWIGSRSKRVALVFSGWSILVVALLELFLSTRAGITFFIDLSPYWGLLLQLVLLFFVGLVLRWHTVRVEGHAWWRKAFPTFPAWTMVAMVSLLIRSLQFVWTDVVRPWPSLPSLLVHSLDYLGIFCVVWSVWCVVSEAIASRFASRSLHWAGFGLLLIIILYSVSRMIFSGEATGYPYVPFLNGGFLIRLWITLAIMGYLWVGWKFMRRYHPMVLCFLLFTGIGFFSAAVSVDVYNLARLLGLSVTWARVSVSSVLMFLLAWVNFFRQHDVVVRKWARRALWLSAGKLYFFDPEPSGWLGWRIALVFGVILILWYRRHPQWCKQGGRQAWRFLQCLIDRIKNQGQMIRGDNKIGGRMLFPCGRLVQGVHAIRRWLRRKLWK